MKESICIVSPSLGMGGIERALLVLANYFVSKGHQVHFISCLAHNHFYKINAKINLFEPKFNHSGRRLNKLVYYPSIVFFIRRTIIKIQPDRVLVFGDWFNPLVLLALFDLKYPVFISDRANPDFKIKFPIPQLKKWLYPRSTGFIAQTRRAAEYNRVKFQNKLNIRVIPNAIRDVTLYPDIMHESIILYVGRFAWVKGPEALIHAFGTIPDRKGWRLYMAGSGPQLNKMKKLVVDLKITAEVVFLGNVPDVDRLYAKAGIYVLPSLFEGFPNSLCEAMAAGLPCISFDSFPYEEIFTNGLDGLAVERGNINELRASIIRLMEDKKLREELGANARRISLKLSVENIGKQFVDFLFAE